MTGFAIPKVYIIRHPQASIIPEVAGIPKRGFATRYVLDFRPKNFENNGKTQATEMTTLSVIPECRCLDPRSNTSRLQSF